MPGCMVTRTSTGFTADQKPLPCYTHLKAQNQPLPLSFPTVNLLAASYQLNLFSVILPTGFLRLRACYFATLFDFSSVWKTTGKISQMISDIKSRKQREKWWSVQNQDTSLDIFVAFAYTGGQSSSSFAQRHIHVHGASVFGSPSIIPLLQAK